MADKPLWYWDDSAQRYRGPDGRFVGIAQMQDLREVFMNQQKATLADLTLRYDAGEINFKQFQDTAKLIIKDTYIDLYAMGAGGRNNMTQRDWGRIGAMLKEQYKYLRDMMGQIARGEISARQAIARFAMYINSANEALWKGITRDLPFTLPAYPGDGSTECLTNCRCEWNIIEIPGEGYDCYWVVDHEAENCDDCLRRGSEWRPWRYRYQEGA
jgi:hypothetical protein